MESIQLTLCKSLIAVDKASALELMRSNHSLLDLPGYEVTRLLNECVKSGYIQRMDDGNVICYAATELCRAFVQDVEAKAKAKADDEERQRKKQVRKKKAIGFSFAAIISLILVVVLLINYVILPNNTYNDAIGLMASGQYEQAIGLFQTIVNHKDARSKIEECNLAMLNETYDYAVALMNAGECKEAIEIFEQLGDFKPEIPQHIAYCNEVLTEETYQKAGKLHQDGQFQQAMDIYVSLGNYKDSTQKAETSKKEYHKQLLANANVGSVVYFGTYEQNGINSDGKEDIEWMVIAKEGDKVLLLSRYVLDMVPFANNDLVNTWSKSSIRTWANSTFYNDAFSDPEQKKIVTTKVTTPKNPSYGTSGGASTNDKLFLLSIQEAETFLNQEQRRTTATTYAFAKMQSSSQHYSSNKECAWFLRSPVKTYNNIAFVSNVATSGIIYGIESDGTHYSGTRPTKDDYYGFRPAMWIDLSQVE